MITKSQRWWDVPAAIFLFGALFSAAIRLQATNWTEHLGRIGFIVFLGAVFGFAMGKSIFSGRIIFIMGLVFTLFIIPWQLGSLTPPMVWVDRLNVVYARLWYATTDFLSNKPVKDPILFLATMMLLYWFASLLSTYRLVRRANPWLPLLSLGAMILVIEYTAEMYRYAKVTGGTYSFLFLLFSLLLVGRLYFLRSRKEWEQRGGTVEMEVGYDLGRGVAVAAVVLALLAWNVPNIINLFDSENPARERVTESWQSFRDRVSKIANSLRSESPVIVEGYGSNLFLGTGGDLSDEISFTVKPENGRVDTRMYWAGRTFDQYSSNGQWQTSLTEMLEIGPTAVPLVYNSMILRHDETFTITTRIPLLKTLYFPSEPLSMNRTGQAVVANSKEGGLDVNAIIMDPPLKANNPYTIRSSVSKPTVLAMREAGEEYPDWVKDRYLQVPEGFSTRVVELANQIAGAEETPYDKAVAVTQYLRRTITYSEKVPQPPRNRDPIEWFLFDLRSGFCNYYASAEVMMLRSLGVPTRMVVGYAEGTWEPELEQYVVVGKDSHAWPEVYFPRLGWIAFEPTVSQPMVSFPAGEESAPASSGAATDPIPQPTFDPFMGQGEQRAEDMMNRQTTRGSALVIWLLRPWNISLILLALVTVVLVFLEWRRRKTQDLPLPSFIEKSLDERGIRTPEWLRLWSRRSLRTPMENLFSNVSLMLRVWGQKVDPAYTPAEQIRLLIRTVPGVKEQAQALLEEYQRAMYSPYPANLLRARQAVSEIRSIGYRSWVMRLVGLEA